ncbi:MAG: OmpH family outer membrane protein [Alphaproteobacteria bacterium]
MRQKSYLALASLVLLGVVGFLWHHSEKTTVQFSQVAVVDWDKILTDLPGMQIFKKNLNDTFQAYQKEFQEKEQKLRAEHQSIVDLQERLDGADKQKSIDLEKRREVFSDKVLQVQKEAEAYQEMLNTFHRESLEKFHKEVNEKIKIFAKEHKIHLIVPKDKTLFVDSSIDLTDDLMKVLSSVELPVFVKE